MAGRQLARTAIIACRLPQRSICTSTVCRSDQVQLDPQTRDKIYPKLGNREIVGYGMNGTAHYIDHTDFPCPAIRFKENTPEVLALREKEKGEWKALTLEEKKELYRASFCQTYAEMNAPTGEWKSITSIVLMGMFLTGWLLLWIKVYVYPDLPKTINREWQESEVRRMIDMRAAPVEGVSSKWDYEKGEWK
ncbi:hypothetical protein ScPMuIL_000044 [Solemya velum]